MFIKNTTDVKFLSKRIYQKHDNRSAFITIRSWIAQVTYEIQEFSNFKNKMIKARRNQSNYLLLSNSNVDKNNSFFHTFKLLLSDIKLLTSSLANS